MTTSTRNYALLTIACFTWALLGSIVYGLQWSANHEGHWVEWIIGGQLRWLPWVGYAYLIFAASRRLESRRWDLAPRMLTHLTLAIGIILFHAVYLRLIRPIPPMILYGRSYSEVFSRFRFIDYLSYQSVFLDLAVYLVIAIPTALLLRRSAHNSPPAPLRALNNSESQAETITALGDTSTPRSDYLERMLIRHADKTLIIPVVEVEWIEAADYYVQLHARGGKFLHRESIQKLEQQLDPAKFIRVHRRALVNSSLIVELVSVSDSKWAVRMKSGALVEVSRRRRRQVEGSLLTGRI